MSGRHPVYSSPTWWQVILAAVAGVCIGLMVVSLMKASQPKPALAFKPSPPTTVAGMQIPQIQMPEVNLNVWPKLESRMTVLLMGVDSNGRGTQRFLQTRSDTMILVSVDPETKKVGMISIPRDSRVRIADEHGVDKINSAHAFGGPELAVKTVSEAFAVPIDHYIVIDTQGLKKLFEVLGPVEVLVEKRMHYRDRAAGLKIALEPGVQRLDATQTEEYLRFRHDPKGDIGRVERQQWFLRQVAKKLKEPQVVLKLPELFKLANEYVVTDLPVDDMFKLAQFGKDIEPSRVETAMLPGRAECIRGGSYWIPDPEGCAVVFNRLLGTPPAVAQIAANTAINASTDAVPEGETETAVYNNDTLSAQYASAYAEHKPTSIVIKYPRGLDEASKAYEAALTAAGYTVRYRTRGDAAECAHEQIVQNSFRADAGLTAKLRNDLTQVNDWPVVIAVESGSPTDFTLVLSPTAQVPPMPTQEASAEATGQSTEAAKETQATAPSTTRHRRRRHTRSI